ncbi:MAG TPA: AbrB family transcriptional regulator [Devosia sp.]|nr:AbrB family transcriptional regulator [Devosia sp.]
MTTFLRALLTIAISIAGGFLVNLTGLPAGWLMGGALAVAAAAISGLPVSFPGWVRDATFVFAGMSMGASVTRDSFALIFQWPVTLAALVVELVLIVTVTGYMLRKLFGLDRGTAYLSSFPGHLAFVMGIAAAGVGDPRQITIIQVIRILMLTTAVPIGALFLPVGPDIALAASQAPAGWLNLALILVICAATGLVFQRLRVPAAFAMGAMAASLTAKFTGIFEGAMPQELLIAIYVMIGGLIGSRFAGITVAEFRAAATGGLIATALTIAIVTIVSYGASTLVDMPFGQIWLGLSPGALEGMGILGIALGFDTAFIAAHHVARLLMLTVAIPVVALLVRETDEVKE